MIAEITSESREDSWLKDSYSFPKIPYTEHDMETLGSHTSHL